MRHSVFFLLVAATLVGGGDSVLAAWEPPPQWSDSGRVADWMKWDAARLRDYNDLPFLEASHRPRGQPAIYAEALRYAAELPAVTLDEFLLLSPREQEHRRDLARDELAPLRGIAREIAEKIQYVRAELSPSWGAVPNQRKLVRILHSLYNAAGLDPSNPHVWHQIAYFHTIVGDGRRAEAALATTFAALGRLPATALPELRRRAALDRAWLARTDGRYADALHWVAEAESVAGAGEESRLIRALCLAQRGDFAGAVELAEEVRSVEIRKYPYDWRGASSRPEFIDPSKWRREPSDFASRWIQALAYLDRGQTGLASHTLGEPRIADIRPYSMWFWNDAGLIAEATGRYRDAALYYALAVAYRPYFNYFLFEIVKGASSDVGNPGARLTIYLGYGEHFLAGSRFSHATNLTLLAMHDLDPVARSRFAEQALEELAICARRGIWPLRALQLRARLFHLRGAYERADTVFTAVRALLADAGVDLPLPLVEAAMTKLRLGEPEAALELLDAAREVAPERPLIARTRAVALAQAGDLAAAKTELNRALALDAEAWPAWLNRGLLGLRADEFDAALVAARRAADLAPESARAAALLAAVERARDRRAAGRPSLAVGAQPAVGLHVEDEEVFVSPISPLGRRRITEYRERQFADRPVDPYAWLGDVATDEETLREAFAADPSPFHRENLARFLIRSGRPEEGLELLLETSSEESSVTTRCLILEADRLLGDAQRARRWAAALASGEPPNRDSYFWSLVAMICLDHGFAAEGRAALEMAIALDPENTGLQMYRDLLGS